MSVLVRNMGFKKSVREFSPFIYNRAAWSKGFVLTSACLISQIEKVGLQQRRASQLQIHPSHLN